MGKVFRMQRRVAWREADWVGLINYPNYFHYCEDAENEFFRANGISKLDLFHKDRMFFPRLVAHCEFKSMVRYDDVVNVEVTVNRLGVKSAGFHYRIVKDADGALAAEGYTVVCLSTQEGKSIPIPEHLRAMLRAYLEDGVTEARVEDS